MLASTIRTFLIYLHIFAWHLTPTVKAAAIQHKHINLRDAEVFEFDTTCDPTRQKIILQAYQDAKLLALSGANISTTPFRGLYPAMDFFGP